MKKSKRISALILCMCLLLCFAFTGCESGTDGVGTGDTGTATEATTTTAEPYVGDLGVEVVDGVTLKYLGGYDILSAGDIRPAYNYFKENFNSEIEVEIVVDAEIMNTLATRISSGSSPDLVDQRGNTFPYFITRQMYEPLDSYIDMTSPAWESVSEYINRYEVNGKHFYYPWAYVISGTILTYNRYYFEEFGLDDPKELWEAGNWTWDTFLQSMKDFVDNNTVVDTPIGIYGMMDSSFLNTTGEALVEYTDGKLVNNLRSPNIERAQMFLEDIRRQGLSMLMYEEFGNISVEPVRRGYAAFQSMGDWVFSDYARIQSRGDETMDIMMVPFPRDPSADAYYLKFGTFGYMVPAGAPNPQLAADFITSVRMSRTDPELLETTKESVMKNKRYTEEQYEMWNYFQSIENFNSDELIIEFLYGLDASLISDTIEPMMNNILFDQSAEQQSWTTMREANFPLLDENVTSLNTALETT